MSVADSLNDSQQPWMTSDLADYVAAIGSMWQAVEVYIDDDPYGDGNGSWSILLDVDRCPYEALPYLAQWNGERIPAGIDDASARREITDGPNSRRGTPRAIARAAQRSMTGQGMVQIVERVMPDGSPDANGDHFNVITWSAETPNPAQVWTDLLTTIPADMVCNYQTQAGASWAQVHSTYGTWAAVHAAAPTWLAVYSVVPTAGVWTKESTDAIQ